MPHRLHLQLTKRMRQVFAGLLAVLATALTAFVALAVLDMATTTYVGYEVGLTRSVTIAAALLALSAWTAAVVLHKSSRHDLRACPDKSS